MYNWRKKSGENTTKTRTYGVSYGKTVAILVLHWGNSVPVPFYVWR